MKRRSTFLLPSQSSDHSWKPLFELGYGRSRIEAGTSYVASFPPILLRRALDKTTYGGESLTDKCNISSFFDLACQAKRLATRESTKIIVLRCSTRKKQISVVAENIRPNKFLMLKFVASFNC